MKKTKVLIIIFVGLFLCQACSKSSSSPSTTSSKGTLSGSITSSSSQSVSGASIIVFNANTNLPVGTISTGANGSYTVQLDSGSYYVKIYAQGYQSIPLRGFSAVPFTVVANNITNINYQMNTLQVTNAGFISGKAATNSGSPLAGVLVVAHSGTAGYSSVTDNSGNYTIYNVPAGSYSVQGFIASYNSDSVSATVTSGSTPATANLALTSGSPGSITGNITFLATTNKDVDISIINPYTRESIPGLTTMTSGGSYTLSNVPNGNYIARATYRNDTLVMDPDWLLKNGEPAVTIAGSSTTRNFSVTGSVQLSSPTNSPSATIPTKISGTTPTFSWAAYPSTSDYAVEVSDENGNVIWGGFTGNGATITRNVTVPASQTSIVYNSDNSAKQPLQPGHFYRWRIYACKNVVGTPSWKLISVSEDQMGLITP